MESESMNAAPKLKPTRKIKIERKLGSSALFEKGPIKVKGVKSAVGF